MGGPCEWHPNGRGYVTLEEMVTNVDCPIPPTVKGFSTSAGVVDEHGHDLDGDFDPAGVGGCQHRDTPEWKAAHRPKRKPPMETVQPQQNPEPEAPSVTPVLVASNEGGQPVTGTMVGVDTAIEQVKSLVPAGADVGAGTLIAGAAALAVVGAAIKIGPKMLEANSAKAEKAHELEMERLKLEREKAEKQDDQHAQCSAARAALEARIAGLQARLDDVQAKAEKAGASSLDLDAFDPDELEKRLKKIEKALKPSASTGRKKA